MLTARVKKIILGPEQLVEIGCYMAIAFACVCIPNLSRQTLSWLLLGVNAYGLWKARKNPYMTIVMVCIAYSNYSIVYANYLHYMSGSYFTIWAQYGVALKGLKIMLAFSIFINLMMPRHMTQRKYYKMALIENNQNNPVIVMGICVILVFILIFGFTRPEEQGMRGSPSSYYEYSLILFILGFYYSGKKRSCYLALSGLAALFTLQNFIYGGRITGLQVILCWGLCVMIDKVQLKILLPIGGILYILMLMIGYMRANLSLTWENIQAVLEVVKDKGFTLDTAYSAHFTSLTFVELASRMPFSGRLALFGRWILSIFLGGSVENSNLAMVTREMITHYGGGILPFFGYFYMGAVGVFMAALLAGGWMRLLAKNNSTCSGLSRCLTIYVTVTVFRWYLYSPSQITRGALILCVLYGMCWITHKLMKKEL